MRRILLLSIFTMLATACDTPRSWGPDSPYFVYPAGSQLVLHHPLQVPADWATARLQFGRVVAFGTVQEQEPHCLFELTTVRPQSQRVAPDRFAIVGVRRSTSDLAAASGFFIRSAVADSDLPSQLFYKTEFFLRSDRQPTVHRLTCQHDQLIAGVSLPRHLTLAEIRTALGALFTLELPPGR